MKPPIFFALLASVHLGVALAAEPVVRLHECPPITFNFSKNDQEQEDPFADPIDDAGWHVSPRVAKRLPGLAEEVYDIREYLAHSGIVAEQAFQLRDLELMVVVATPEMQEATAQYIEMIRWGRAMILEFVVTLSIEGELELAKVLFPARSGHRIKIVTSGSNATKMALDFDPAIGPAASFVDLDFTVAAETGSGLYSLSTTTKLAFESPQKIVLGLAGEAAENLILSVVANYRPVVPKPEVSEETKGAIIKEIEISRGVSGSR